MKAATRAAIYVRVSTDEQLDGYGLAGQLEECQRLAANRGYEVTEIYRDEGISGTTSMDQRPGFQAAMSAAVSGEFSHLLIYAWDRFARSLPEAMAVLPFFLTSEIEIVEVRSGQEFRGQGVLMALIKLWGADEDHKKILERTKRGHISRAKAKKVAGPPPFGYDKSPDGGLIINDDEAAIVRRVYELYATQGFGVDKIAALLNAEGIKTKRAKANEEGRNKFIGAGRWQRSTILCMFRNPVYKGQYVYGKTHGKVPAGREYQPSEKRPVRSKAVQVAHKNRKHIPHEQITVEVPAIIEPELWERVQAQREKRSNSGPIKRLREGATKYNYLFPGTVRCHLCRRVMTPWKQPFARKRDGAQGIRGYYVCRNKDHQCPNLNKYHDIGRIDLEIIRRITPYLENPDLTWEGLSATIQHRQLENAALASKLEAAQKQSQEAHSELKRLTSGYLKGLIDDDQMAEMRPEYDEKIAKCEREIAELQGQVRELAFNEDLHQINDVIDLFESFKDWKEPWPELDWMDSARMKSGEMIWWGGVSESDVLNGNEIPQDAPIIQIVRGLLKYVTVDENSQIVDYVLRITPSEAPKGKRRKPSGPRQNGTTVTPVGEPLGSSSPSDEPANYKAKRNSMTSPS